MNDQLYEESLKTAKEQEKIAEEEAIEAAKIAFEKEKEEEKQKIKEWAEENKKILEEKTFPLEFVKFANYRAACWDRKREGDIYPLVICFEKNNFEGFVVTWEVKFKNGYTHIAPKDTIILPSYTIYDFHLDNKTLIDLEYANSLKDHVDEVIDYIKKNNL